MNSIPLFKSVTVLLLFILAIGGLYFARDFLVPIAIAGVFAMLFLPLSRRLERKGFSRAIGISVCIFILLSIVAGIAALISWQVADLSEDTAKMQEQLTKIITQARQWISDSLGISREKQKQILEQQKSSSAGNTGSLVAAVLGSMTNIVVNSILVLVYLFLFLFLRDHIKKFILKLVPQEDRQKSVVVMTDASRVAQQYLSGLGMMIACLWVMYGIGFSIAGVKNAVFFAILCGLLEIVPFIGNITGTALTVMMVFAQGGNSNMLTGVLLTYLVVQFLQTYILEPLVVGAEVKINPLFTILVIVAGEMIWGVPGMILAIPILGICKIICDNVESLKPYGFLIGEEKKPKKNSGMGSKMKGWFKGK